MLQTQASLQFVSMSSKRLNQMKVPHSHLRRLQVTLSQPSYLIFVSIKQSIGHTIASVLIHPTKKQNTLQTISETLIKRLDELTTPELVRSPI